MYLVIQIACGLLLGAYALRAIEYLRERRRERPRVKREFRVMDLLLGLATVAVIIQIVYLF